jgi:hypothetical protein
LAYIAVLTCTTDSILPYALARCCPRERGMRLHSLARSRASVLEPLLESTQAEPGSFGMRNTSVLIEDAQVEKRCPIHSGATQHACCGPNSPQNTDTSTWRHHHQDGRVAIWAAPSRQGPATFADAGLNAAWTRGDCGERRFRVRREPHPLDCPDNPPPQAPALQRSPPVAKAGIRHAPGNQTNSRMELPVLTLPLRGRR